MSKDENALFLKDPAGDYPTIVRGEGIHLHDDEGRRWIDGAAGASNVTLGHGRTDIARVLGEQAETLAYAFSIHFESRPARDYAARLTALAPGDLNKAYFVSGGSEAIESAMKIARQYHLLRGNEGKQILISRWGGYHGGTLGAMSLSGVPGPRAPFAPWLADFPHIAPCYPYRCRFEGCDGVCNLACADDLEVEIRRRGPENVAAFVCEPVPIAAFVCGVPPEGYFARVREICDRHDVLFIADEIVTGFGRSGRPLRHGALGRAARHDRLRQGGQQRLHPPRRRAHAAGRGRCLRRGRPGVPPHLHLRQQPRGHARGAGGPRHHRSARRSSPASPIWPPIWSTGPGASSTVPASARSAPSG